MQVAVLKGRVELALKAVGNGGGQVLVAEWVERRGEKVVAHEIVTEWGERRGETVSSEENVVEREFAYFANSECWDGRGERVFAERKNDGDRIRSGVLDGGQRKVE